MNLTNRVYTRDAADSLEYRGQAYCLICLHHYRLIVDPDTEYHERVYHVELAAGIIKNLRKATSSTVEEDTAMALASFWDGT